MRELSHFDDCVALYADDDDADMVIVEPCLIAFAPVHGGAHCVCGAPLQPWSCRCVAVNRVELGCARCNRVHGVIRFGTKVRR